VLYPSTYTSPADTYPAESDEDEEDTTTLPAESDEDEEDDNVFANHVADVV
jgi:hypothetical protein